MKTAILIILSVIILSSAGYLIWAVKEIDRNARLKEALYLLEHRSDNAFMFIQEFILNAYSASDFYVKGDNEQTIRFKEQSDSLMLLLKEIKLNEPKYAATLDSISRCLEFQKESFSVLKDLYRKKGFKDQGIEGQMRNAIHTIENGTVPYDKVKLLMMRRHEKDFLLRKDTTYIDKFYKEYSDFVNDINENTTYDASSIAFIQEYFSRYVEYFNEIKKIEYLIGVPGKPGLKQKMDFNHAEMKRLLIGLVLKVQRENDRSSARIGYLLSGVFIMALGCIALIIWVFASYRKMILVPLSELKDIASKISKGQVSVSFLSLKKYFFFNQIADALESTRISTVETIERLSDISARKFKDGSEIRHESDEIGRVLQRIKDEIILMDETERKRQWSNEQLSRFSALITQGNTGQDRIFILLKELVKTCGANQGAVYVVETDQEYSSPLLRLSAAYAYERRKFVEQVWQPGEGLIGQAFLEADKIILKNIPPDYIKITSGLGESLPSYLIILPIAYNKEVVGILELAFFKEPEAQVVQYLELSVEQLGAWMVHQSNHLKTKQLLEESLEQTKMMKEQEEVLRQQMEELMAIKEQAERDTRTASEVL